MPIPLQKLIDNTYPRNEILFCLRTLYILAVFIQVHQIRGPNAVLLIYFFVLLSSCIRATWFIMPRTPTIARLFQQPRNQGQPWLCCHPFRCWSRSQRAAHTYPKPHSCSWPCCFYRSERQWPNFYLWYGSLSELGIGYYLWLNDQRSLVFDHCFYWGYGNLPVPLFPPLDSNENYHIGSKFQRF